MVRGYLTRDLKELSGQDLWIMEGKSIPGRGISRAKFLSWRTLDASRVRLGP